MQDDDDPEFSPIFTYLRPRGKEQLKVQNYVGVIWISEGVQIEVLPKLSKHMETDAARDLLVRMLIELEDSPFFEGNAADLRAHEMPLYELLLRFFLEQVVMIVRKGIARAYVPKHSDATAVATYFSISLGRGFGFGLGGDGGGSASLVNHSGASANTWAPLSTQR